MKNDLLFLTLLYAVAAASFIGAINARGRVRVIITYALATLILCAAVFHTSQYFTVAHIEETPVVVPTPPPPPPPEPTPIAPAVDTAALAAAQAQVAIGESKVELKSVLDVAKRISQSLTALNLGGVADISDEEYEVLQNKTVGYLSESRKVKEKLTPLVAKAPAALKETVDNLTNGVENLVAGAYNAERFFKSENDTEEKTHLAAFRRGNQAANALFKKAATELGSESTGE